MKKILIMMFAVVLMSVGFSYAQDTTYDVKATAIVTVLEGRISHLSEPEEKQERQKLCTKLELIRKLFPNKPEFIGLIDAILNNIKERFGTTSTTTTTTTIITTTTSTGGTTTGGNDQSLELIRQQVLDLINAERKKAGLTPFTLNPLLNEASQKQAAYMRETDDFAHTSKNGSTFISRADAVGYKYSALGENIAAGQNDPVEVVNAWMGSDGHRTNILDTKYTEMGIGFYKEYWVQMFGKPMQ